MNVASLELCRELYELSGWEDTAHSYAYHTDETHIVCGQTGQGIGETWDYCPAYDLGYLLRKLPGNLDHCELTIWRDSDLEHWLSGYQQIYRDNRVHLKEYEYADTPEEALAELSIKLFKQGILKKDSSPADALPA